MCLIISPAGRYYWSRYESEYRIRFEYSKIQDLPISREAPSSADDTFEIAPDYANNFDIYLSMMGKEAISLREFLQIVQEQST